MSDCIEWPGTVREDGRPVVGGRYVYRIVFEQVHGKLRTGMVLHHTCDNPRCINPAHLRAMTQGEHLHAHGLPGDNHQAAKTHCPQGHAYDAENTYHYAGERHCKACRREAKLRYLQRWREARKIQS